MDGLVSITVTAANADDLAAMAHTLVSERLVACANITPGIRSVYRWDGMLHDEDEALAILHTRADILPAVFDRIRELHPYQSPQLVALPIVQADDDYATWVSDCTAF